MIEEELFHRALEMPTPAEQAAFLDQACAGQPELRQRVERLLRSHRHEDSFLQAEPTATLDAPATAGLVIAGRYKLLEEIGEGGMGTVWMAEQTEPVQRRVAVKLIKPGMDSKQIVARFEAERQALALMDHPNIAKVFDGGLTEAGRPYFVMELVKGTPITKYCDEKKLPVRERLELFADVCRAIQHAHQKGLIHRDLKPSNVQVGLYDGRPVVKVIDFGVAKATGQKLTEATLLTGFGAVIGTPEYMSPEQATLENLDVDTRSDIYSLGVLLYELLTGTTPVSRKRVKDAALLEVLRVVREEDPPRPSAWLSTTEELPSIAANRGLEPKRLSGLVRGELDWIVMKSLEKDRNRRYESANALGSDVQRYLAGEPVLAVPPSGWYRLRKAVRRNRSIVAVTAVVGAALAVALVTLVVSNTRVIRENALKEQALQDKDKALRRASEQQRRAEKNFQEALSAVDQMLTRVAQQRLNKEPRAEKLRQALLEDALAYYQRFLAVRGTDPRVRLEAGAIYRRVGNVRRQLGQTTESADACQQAIGLLAPLLAETSEDAFRARAGHELGQAHQGLGRTFMATGRHEEAERAFEQAIKALERVKPEPSDAMEVRKHLAAAWNDLGALQRVRGKINDAERAIRRSLELFRELANSAPDKPEYQSAIGARLNNLATLQMSVGNPAKARLLLEEAVTCQRAAVKAEPNNPLFRAFLRNHLENLAMVQNGMGDSSAGLATLREVIPLSERLAVDYPSIPDYRQDLAGSCFNLALVLQQSGKAEEAENVYRRAFQISKRLVSEVPNAIEYQVTLADGYGNQAELFRTSGRSADAEAALRQCVEVYNRIVERSPNLEYESSLAISYRSLGDVLWLAGRSSEAKDIYRKALPLARNLVAARSRTGGYWHTLGTLLYRLENWAESLAALERAGSLGAGDGATLFMAAIAAARLGHTDDARKWFDRGVGWMEKNKSSDPESIRLRTAAAQVLGLKVELPAGTTLPSKK